MLHISTTWSSIWMSSSRREEENCFRLLVREIGVNKILVHLMEIFCVLCVVCMMFSFQLGSLVVASDFRSRIPYLAFGNWMMVLDKVNRFGKQSWINRRFQTFWNFFSFYQCCNKKINWKLLQTMISHFP